MAKANFYKSSLIKMKDWSRNARPRLLKAVILGLVIGFLGLLLSPFQFMLNLEENTGLGLLFKLRGVEQPSDEVVVVSIEKESSDALELPNNPDKWPRSLHARLVDNLVTGRRRGHHLRRSFHRTAQSGGRPAVCRCTKKGRQCYYRRTPRYPRS